MWFPLLFLVIFPSFFSSFYFMFFLNLPRFYYICISMCFSVALSFYLLSYSVMRLLIFIAFLFLICQTYFLPCLGHHIFLLFQPSVCLHSSRFYVSHFYRHLLFASSDTFVLHPPLPLPSTLINKLLSPNPLPFVHMGSLEAYTNTHSASTQTRRSLHKATQPFTIDLTSSWIVIQFVQPVCHMNWKATHPHHPLTIHQPPSCPLRISA